MEQKTFPSTLVPKHGKGFGRIKRPRILNTEQVAVIPHLGHGSIVRNDKTITRVYIQGKDFIAGMVRPEIKGGNYTFYTFVEPDGNIVRTMDTYSNGFSAVTGVPDYQRKDYCSYVMPPVTLADGKNEITALVSYNLPFTVSTDYFTATWYLARIRDNYYINMSNIEPYYPTATSWMLPCQIAKEST